MKYVFCQVRGIKRFVRGFGHDLVAQKIILNRLGAVGEVKDSYKRALVTF